ncbi:MAG: R3H domain-containing nucleic acid-binding protein [Patescibacteria group bacterium]|nr:KH domain-containing protein [Patescibacteria group bacterium]
MDTEQKTIEKIAKELLKNMGLKGKVSVTDDKGHFLVNIEGENLGILIGYHGETLNAFQLILGMGVYRKLDKWVKILVDVGNYRKEREEKLAEIAGTSAQKARFLQKNVELRPMSPYERMLVHSAVSKIEGVKSESVGEGRERHIVISPS